MKYRNEFGFEFDVFCDRTDTPVVYSIRIDLENQEYESLVKGIPQAFQSVVPVRSKIVQHLFRNDFPFYAKLEERKLVLAQYSLPCPVQDVPNPPSSDYVEHYIQQLHGTIVLDQPIQMPPLHNSNLSTAIETALYSAKKIIRFEQFPGEL